MWRSTRVNRDVPGASNVPVGRGRASHPEAEQRLKRGHRVPPTIVPKDQVDLQLRLTDPGSLLIAPLVIGGNRTDLHGSRASNGSARADAEGHRGTTRKRLHRLLED